MNADSQLQALAGSKLGVISDVLVYVLTFYVSTRSFLLRATVSDLYNKQIKVDILTCLSTFRDVADTAGFSVVCPA